MRTDVTIQRRTSLRGLRRVHTYGMSRRWLLGIVGGAALVLIAAGGVLLIQHQHDDVTDSDRGSLTSGQYDTAVRLARSEIAKDQAEVTQAVAYVVPGKVKQPNLGGECTSGQVLVVSLVGHFPHIIFGSGLASPLREPRGTDRSVTMKADPTTGQECLTGVSRGRFKAVARAANLLPAL